MRRFFVIRRDQGVAMSFASNISNRASRVRSTMLAALAVATITSITSFAGSANATVRKEGTWPENEKPVSLDVSEVSRQEAVKELADAAGWSVVMPSSDS